MNQNDTTPVQQPSMDAARAKEILNTAFANLNTAYEDVFRVAATCTDEEIRMPAQVAARHLERAVELVQDALGDSIAT